jgi:hypothetical protein
MLAFLVVVPADMLFAQYTVIKLPRTDTSASVTVTDNADAVLMKLNADGGFCLYGNSLTGSIPATGYGTRLMWYPEKSAFRAGRVESTQWDDSNTGFFSVAMGYNAIANGYNSVSLGRSTTASGLRSVALGSNVLASAELSTAMGDNTVASGYNSTAMGAYTTASNDHSVAMGYMSLASGRNAFAMGEYADAIGDNSTSFGYNAESRGRCSLAFGCNTTASGNYSTAIGWYVSTNNYGGSFIVGDTSSGSTTNSSAVNQMTMRFAGGYRLFTNSSCTTGVTLAAGGNSWASVSDSTKKTNFERADGENFLFGISKLRLGSWNYKGQDSRKFRHYGPMAQEIFSNYGKDSYGTIGNDTTLGASDMDGIILICLQALEKRTDELRRSNERIEEHEIMIRSLQEKIEKLNRSLTDK